MEKDYNGEHYNVETQQWINITIEKQYNGETL